MKLIKAPTLARAHELAVKYVMDHGTIVHTEDEELTVETDEICIEVRSPLEEPMLSPKSKFKLKFVQEYADHLLHGNTSEFEYDYHERLFEWFGMTDQIQYIINTLKDNVTSRRAIAITWEPTTDQIVPDVPCLQLVQCIRRSGKLHMKVVFRSNDVLSAMGSNMYALVMLQKYIADALETPIGFYTHIALIPHIYYRRDASDVGAFADEGGCSVRI